MSSRLRAAIQYALDAIEDGTYRLAEGILLNALEDADPDEDYARVKFVGAYPSTSPEPARPEEAAGEGGTAS